MQFEVKDVDKAFYRDQLASFLPQKIIDIHAHVWLKVFRGDASVSPSANWPLRVAKHSPIEDLLHRYELIFPQQEVTPVIFGWPGRDVNLAETNDYVTQVAQAHGLPSLIVTTPEWSTEELEQRVVDGGFLGLKPYLDFAPVDLNVDEITVFDFLPHHHLEVADAHGWIVMLHIPRAGRLRDPVNLMHMLEIERRYPRVRLVIAHIGRAYCAENVGNAFEVLRDSNRMFFDFSANTNAEVMEGLIRAVGAKRVVFGTDLPITRMRMRRVCEGGVYVNLVPPGLYGDLSDEPHMREVSEEEGEKLSLFVYEQLLAFRGAAEATSLGADDVQDILYNNAARVITGAAGML